MWGYNDIRGGVTVNLLGFREWHVLRLEFLLKLTAITWLQCLIGLLGGCMAGPSLWVGYINVPQKILWLDVWVGLIGDLDQELCIVAMMTGELDKNNDRRIFITLENTKKNPLKL